MARTSVIIDIGNRHKSIDIGLEALRRGLPPGGEVEVVVVGEELPSSRWLPPAGGGPGLRLFPRKSGEPSVMACNAAAASASGEYLIFLDACTIGQAGWVGALLDHAALHPSAGVIGSKLVDANGSISHAGVVIGQDRYPRPLYAGFPADHPVVDKSRRFQVVNLDGALIRRSVFDLLGGFDAAFSGGFEDVDLCLRQAGFGYETRYCHRSVLFQANRASERCDPRIDEGRRAYRSRWAQRVSPDDFYYLIEDGLLTISYGPSDEMRVVVSPPLGQATEAEPDQAGGRLVAVPSKALIELMTRTIELTRQVQEVAGKSKVPYDEASARVGAYPLYSERLNGVANGDDACTQAAGAEHHGDGPVARPPQNLPISYPTLPEIGDEPRPRRTKYPLVRRRIADAVDAKVPPGMTVIVVSKGDDRLLELGPRRAWHFPQDKSGTYAGFHPASSREAIDHLEELRDKGGDFLLFPSTGFWWLGYYREFQKHLETNYTCVWSDADCLIFQLADLSDGRDPRP